MNYSIINKAISDTNKKLDNNEKIQFINNLQSQSKDFIKQKINKTSDIQKLSMFYQMLESLSIKINVDIDPQNEVSTIISENNKTKQFFDIIKLIFENLLSLDKVSIVSSKLKNTNLYIDDDDDDDNTVKSENIAIKSENVSTIKFNLLYLAELKTIFSKIKSNILDDKSIKIKSPILLKFVNSLLSKDLIIPNNQVIFILYEFINELENNNDLTLNEFKLTYLSIINILGSISKDLTILYAKIFKCICFVLFQTYKSFETDDKKIKIPPIINMKSDVELNSKVEANNSTVEKKVPKIYGKLNNFNFLEKKSYDEFAMILTVLLMCLRSTELINSKFPNRKPICTSTGLIKIIINSLNQLNRNTFDMYNRDNNLFLNKLKNIVIFNEYNISKDFTTVFKLILENNGLSMEPLTEDDVIKISQENTECEEKWHIHYRIKPTGTKLCTLDLNSNTAAEDFKNLKCGCKIEIPKFMLVQFTKEYDWLITFLCEKCSTIINKKQKNVIYFVLFSNSINTNHLFEYVNIINPDQLLTFMLSYLNKRDNKLTDKIKSIFLKYLVDVFKNQFKIESLKEYYKTKDKDYNAKKKEYSLIFDILTNTKIPPQSKLGQLFIPTSKEINEFNFNNLNIEQIQLIISNRIPSKLVSGRTYQPTEQNLYNSFVNELKTLPSNEIKEFNKFIIRSLVKTIYYNQIPDEKIRTNVNVTCENFRIYINQLYHKLDFIPIKNNNIIKEFTLDMSPTFSDTIVNDYLAIQ